MKPEIKIVKEEIIDNKKVITVNANDEWIKQAMAKINKNKNKLKR